VQTSRRHRQRSVATDLHRRIRASAGFTLVEVLVSVILINAGLLALVAASAVLVRQTNELRARTAANQAAINRLQSMGATACAPFGGSANSGALHEEFTAVLAGGGVREFRDSVSYLIGRQPHAVLLRTRLSC
jgi:Tfp pilus assembly protein PilV